MFELPPHPHFSFHAPLPQLEAKRTQTVTQGAEAAKALMEGGGHGDSR